MRIALVSDAYTPDVNGVVSSVVTLQKALEKLGHTVFIITNHKGLHITKEGNVLRLPGIELKKLYGYKISTPFHISATSEVEKMNLDVMHVHTEFGVGIFGRMAAKSLNIPVVTTYHTNYEDYTHYINLINSKSIDKISKKAVAQYSRFISNGAQCVISPSAKTKETLIEYGVYSPIFVIPTGLDFDSFKPEYRDYDKVAAIKKQYGIMEDDHIVVYIGRIANEKSIDIQIRGMQYVKDEKIKLMIVGGGPILDDLKALAKSLHLDNRVIFTDQVLNAEIGEYYACGECFVSASLSETQGLTYIEAMAAHLPVFARYDDVLKELVVQDECGAFFSDEQDFAAKISAYFTLDEEAREKQKEMAATIVEKYDSKVFAQKVLEVYYQAIDNFANCYEVIRINSCDTYVKITFMNASSKENEVLCVSLDDYIDMKISLHTSITFEQFEFLKEKEAILLAYSNAIHKLCNHAYSEKQMLEYLNRDASLDEEAALQIMDKLKEAGYLNDYNYVVDRLNSVRYALKGKNAIEKDLRKKGISQEIIDEALVDYDVEEDTYKALQAAKKIKNSLTGMSLKEQKQKMIDKLLQAGFDFDIIKDSVEKIFEGEKENYGALESLILKAKRRYERKYEGNVLKQKVITYCCQKGYMYQDIVNKIEEMEYFNE